MKRNILALCALAAASSMFAQSYQVVVTTKDGEKSVFTSDQLANISFTDAPTYIAANTLLEATYNPRTSNARYDFSIGTEQPDDEGQPAEIGGLQLALSLYAPLSEEAQNAKLSEGYYRVANSGESYTISSENSALWMRTAEGSDGVAVGYVVGGTVDVKCDGDWYDIRAELELLGDATAEVSYVGPIKFAVGSSGAVDFTEDVNVAFTEGQGRVWANWFNPFCDDGSLQFFTGTFNESGSQTEGYYLYVPYYMPKDAKHTSNWAPVVTDGVYTIDPRLRVTSQTYLPYTISIGQVMEVMGSSTPMGCYITYLAADGRVSMAVVESGTMVVSNNGTHFDFDFISSNGIKITGSYDKKPYIVNYIDNSSEPVLPDGLTSDYTLSKFPSDVAVIDYNCGDYIIEGTNSHILMFSDPEQTEGDYLCLEVLSNSEAELKDGTYAIDNSLTDLSGIKGFVSFAGNMEFSWYGDLDSTDDEGYQSILAPIHGGSFTVTTLSDGNRKFDFNLLDMNGNKVTGTFTHAVTYVDYSTSSTSTVASKMESAKRRALGKVNRTWGGSHQSTPSPTLMK